MRVFYAAVLEYLRGEGGRGGSSCRDGCIYTDRGGGPSVQLPTTVIDPMLSRRGMVGD